MKLITTFFLLLTITLLGISDEKDTKSNDGLESTPVFFSGIVTDKNSGEVLVGVEVRIDGTNKKTYTDFDGNFSFDDILPGKYSISANYISYQNHKIEKIDVNFVNNFVNVKLEPQN